MTVHGSQPSSVWLVLSTSMKVSKEIIPNGPGTCWNAQGQRPKKNPNPPLGPPSFAPLLPEALEMILMRMATEEDLRPTLLGPGVIEGVHRDRSLL